MVLNPPDAAGTVDASPAVDAPVAPDAPPEPPPPGDSLHVGVYDHAVSDPQMVIDVHGRSHMAWIESGRLYERAYTIENQWDETVNVSGSVAGSVGGGQVRAFALGGGQIGDLLAVWQTDLGDGRHEVWARHYRVSGAGWGTPMRLSNPSFLDAGDPAAIACCGGFMWAAWTENSTALWARRHEGGPDQVWDTAVRVDNGLGHRVWGARLASGLSGHAVIAWYQSGANPADTEVWASRYEYWTDSWSPPRRLDDDTHGVAEDLSVDVGGNGEAMVVWSKRDGQARWTAVWASEVTRNGPRGRVAIDAGGNGGWAPQVARDEHGNSVVVWLQSDPVNGLPQVRSRRHHADSGWSLIETLSPPGVTRPHIAMNMAGDTTVVWHGQQDVWVTRLEVAPDSAGPGDTWTEPVRVDNHLPSGVVMCAGAAASDAGDAYVFWCHNDDGLAVDPDIWARVLRQPTQR
jgi:hypothetical protein